MEGVLLSLAGGLIGLLLASWGVDLLLALRPRGIPRLDEIGVDHATLAFAILVYSIVVGKVMDERSRLVPDTTPRPMNMAT